MANRKKALYTWNWIGGGYNQHYAYTKKEAMAYANTITSLKVNLTTVNRCTSTQETEYWNNLPYFD